MELVTGATGYVGGRLIHKLLADGRAVRAMARNPAPLEGRPGIEVATADVLTGKGVEAALEGCSTAYYLVHSMEPGGEANGSFSSRDRRAAETFGRAAAAAGVERIVYLGGIVPENGPQSAHLRSRLEVEETLLAAVPGSTALRASILIGAQSSSFRILVRLVERLRVLPFPAWHGHRTRPIDERDAIDYLALTPNCPPAASRSLDIGGPDLLSYGAMIRRIAEAMGVGRLPLNLRLSATPAASPIVSAVTGQPLELVRPLMESLEHDLLPRNDEAHALYRLRLRPFDRAVDHALGDWERHEALGAR